MKLRLLLFTFLSTVSYAQEISTELPVMSPQSPTTSDLGKYGEIQVNESTGVISPSIPLFEYNAGAISIPITLGYSGNGVRVNQDPTWAGVNWNINPGGVITRTVNDLPDELTQNDHRLYLSESDLDNLDGVRELNPNTCYLNPYTEWFNVMKSLANQTFDSEVDIFNYNFLGYSGSFFIDKNNIAHLIKYDKEVAILFQNDPNNIYGPNSTDNPNKSEIIITTPDGNTFYFGGTTASESSRTWVNNGSGSTANVGYAQNGFYLHTIKFSTGGFVFFEYDNYDITSDTYKIGIQESASVGFPLGNFPCNKTTKTLYNDVQNLVKLKKITNTFNNQYVEFQSSFYGISNRMVKLNNIFLKINLSTLKKFHLNYLTINNETETLERKFFLQKVEYFNRNNDVEYDYELTYNNPENFPSKDSFAQDHLGYYNGVNSNTTLLPRSTNPLLNENCFFGLADREANFNASLIGSLKEIKYPTGGYSQFEYELPYKGEEDVYEGFLLRAYMNGENNNPSSGPLTASIPNISYTEFYETINPIGGTGPLILTSTKNIFATVNINGIGSYSHAIVVKLIAINTVNNQNYSSEYTINDVNITGNTYSPTLNLTLPSGNYIFKLSLQIHNSAVNSSNSVMAIAQLSLPTGTRPAYQPGLRIKRVKNYDNNNNMDIKRYYYNNRFQLNVESFQFFPNYTFTTAKTVPDDPVFQLVPIYNLSTNSVKNIFNNDMGGFIYENVTISYGGDSFENGGKQSTFQKQSNYPPDSYLIHPCYENVPEFMNENEIQHFVNASTNDSYQNSVLTEEIIFNKNMKVLNKKQYNYIGEPVFTANNIKLFNWAYVGSNFLTGNIYLLYKTKSYNYRLVSTETKEYFGSNFTNEISSTTNFTYAPDKVSLPSVIETVNSAGDSKSTNLYYPSDVSSLNYDSTDIAIINNMQNIKHNVSQVIRSESFEGSSLLDSKQVYFNAQGLPIIISSSKGQNNLEERVIIHSYFYGKPALVSLKDGTKIKYEYNSNLQVVLKIENYVGSVVPIDPIDPDNLPVINNPSSTTSTSPCQFQDEYPESMVTSYEYDNVTNNLIKITDPKCNVITYEYDNFGRLEFVRDNDGNILNKNEYHYKN